LARQTQLIAWRPGDGGWSTLNTDGSRISSTGATSIGGLIRNEKGEFVRAFCANIGDCSITRAELRAIVEGLKLAWSLGLRRVVVQTDSRAAVSILQKGVGMQHQHVYREANCAADHLANLGHSFVIGMYLFDFPDASLAHWLRYDLIGVALPRVTLFHPKKIQIENLRNLKKPNKIVTIPTTWTPPMSNESTIS
ncbi:Putative ribonuclease H protein At1g65750, partial [Linum perenne]